MVEKSIFIHYRGHDPTQGTKKLECTVCSAKRVKHNLPRDKIRHESRIIRSQCNVNLCVNNDRNCFSKYHTV